MSHLRVVAIILACSGLATPYSLLAECPNFGPAAHYSAATSPRSIAVADFNGDGNLDYATANSGSNTVSVRLGDGNGGFGTATVATVGLAPYGIVAADFNRDGRIDLATANSGIGSNSVSVLLGNGSGGFAAALTSNAGTTPRSIATADFNRDGKPDIAVANAGSSVVDNGNSVAIFNGFSNGTFAAAVFYPVGNAPNAIATGDFDGNGSVDLAVIRTSATTTILLNNGSGAFTASGTADSADFVMAGDFSGDGKLDLALLHTHSMTIAIGNGAGSFTGGGTEFPIGGNIQTSMAAGDFNRDGRVDLAATDWSSNDVAVFLNSSHCAANCASFNSGGSFTASNGPNGVATGDFNHDGFPDVATANVNSNNLSILLGNGSGFGAPLNVNIGTSSSSVAVADLNRDGVLEAIVSNPTAQSFTVVPSNGTTYTMAAKLDGFPIYSVAVADFNRDGLPDLVFASPNNNSATVYTTVGPGITFSDPVRYTMGSLPFFVAAADVNGDGKADLISANAGTADVTVRLADNVGGFGTPANYGAGDGPRFIAVADFNHDGRVDLAVANDNAGTVSILLGVGAGAFGPPTDYTVGELPRSIAVGDFDLDGNLDLAVVNQFANTLMVLKGSAAGTFTVMPEYGTGTNPASVATADFNRDGKLDLVVASNIGTNISLLTNSCPAAELTVLKRHSLGSFSAGQVGAQYTMVVTNSGGNAPTVGPITVVDSLPTGLVATALGGVDWSCDLATLTCTRSTVLAQGVSTPPIVLTVNVRSSAPALVTNTASVSVGIELNPDNNESADPTVVTADPNHGPTYLVATAESTSQVNLTWDGVAGATEYQVIRKTNGVAEALVRVPGTSYADLAVSPGMAYVYAVGAVNGTGGSGNASNWDLATTIFFTDDPLTPLVRAVHFTELQTAVQAVRTAAGLPNASFTDAIAPGVMISAVHLTQLRAFLDEARSTLGLTPLGYTDPVVEPGVTTIKGAHVMELRSSMR